MASSSKRTIASILDCGPQEGIVSTCPVAANVCQANPFQLQCAEVPYFQVVSNKDEGAAKTAQTYTAALVLWLLKVAPYQDIG